MAKKKYSRSVDTFFRVMARNQVNLNQIADNKANLLITLNILLFSTISGFLATTEMRINAYIVPAVTLMVTNIATTITAILATRPKYRKKHELKHTNLLFFKNIANEEPQTYSNKVLALFEDETNVYNNLALDQQQLAQILTKKFNFLKASYNILLTGISVTAIIVFYIIIFNPLT
jgi:hypothetical protein